MKRLAFFFRLLTWFSVRQLRMHPWRALAVLVGVGLGAGVFTSVRLAVDASLDSFTRSVDQLSGRSDWVVTCPGGRVPEALVKGLLLHPAVEAASPLITSYVERKGKIDDPFMLVGLDPILDRPFRTWRAVAPSMGKAELWLDLIRTPATILISPALAESQGISPGEKLTLVHVHQPSVFRVLDLLEPEGLALVDGGRIAVADIATMQEFTGTQGWLDRIDLKLKPQATKEDLKSLRALLPPGVVLAPPTELKETGQSLIQGYQLNLSVLSFVSLFVGMFLVYNLVALHAASRRREVAILRSLGASSRLVFVLFLSEGALFGVFGWLCAIPLGSLMVRYLLSGISRTINDLFVPLHVQGLRVDGWEISLSFAVTLLVSLLAAYGPAREAEGIAPREALLMHAAPSRVKKKGLRIQTLSGAVLICLSWPVSRLPNPSGLPISGYLAVFALFCGFSFLSPLLLHLIGSRLSQPLRRIGGEPAFLGARYMGDAGRRTAVAIGALITAMALFVALAVTVQSFRYTVVIWLDQTLNGDIFLRPKMAGLNQYRDNLPPETVRALKEIPTDAELLPYRRIHLKYGGKVPYQLEATDLERFLQYGNFILVRGDLKKMRHSLTTGQGVLVSEVFANQTGLCIGGRYMARVGNGRIDLPILGVCRDYRTQGGVVHIALAPFQRISGDNGWSGARFFFSNRKGDLESSIKELRARILRRCGEDHPLEVASGKELHEEVLRIFDQTFAITTVLLLIALLVAGLGITTTLTVMVLERIRQLGTLFAIGASARQIRAMISWEALLMVTVGEFVGVFCGFFLSFLLIYVINRESFGWTFLLHVDWAAVIFSYPLILMTALVASLPAVRLALRSSPALALREQ